MNYNNILFLDIETVSQYETYNHLPEDWKELWDLKAGIINRNRDEETSETAYPRAAIYAEFGKIICISCGYLQGSGEEKKLIIKSYCGDDEKKILKEFSLMLQQWSGNADKYLCAHNGKEFDYPYLCRRMLINSISLPAVLNLSGKRSWEVPHLDTMELWKFGDYKSFTSLKLLTKILSIPSPKGDIDGSMVGHVFHVENDIDRIVTYCEKDVVAVAQVLLRMRREDLLVDDEIIHV